MSSQIVPLRDRVANVRGLLERSKPQLALALPKHLSVDRLFRVAMTSVQRTPKLLECTPQSLLAAVMQAAQLGLEPDSGIGYAYLVPFKQQVQLIPGYRGLLKLARNSGEISTIMAHAVHQADQFAFAFGLQPELRHVPSNIEDPGPVVAFYAVARLRDGGAQFEVMWKREVDAIRKRSRASSDGPWVTDYEEMGKKTVLRRLCKMLPASVEMATAVSLDERAEAGIPQDLAVEVTDVQPEPEPETKEMAVREPGSDDK